jgi:hypothetical protein
MLEKKVFSEITSQRDERRMTKKTFPVNAMKMLIFPFEKFMGVFIRDVCLKFNE